MTFTDSIHCTSHAHCKTCRSDPAWRRAVGAPDICPYGVTGLGDMVARVTTAIGIKKCGGCQKRQDKLNSFWFRFLEFVKKITFSNRKRVTIKHTRSNIHDKSTPPTP